MSVPTRAGGRGDDATGTRDDRPEDNATFVFQFDLKTWRSMGGGGGGGGGGGMGGGGGGGHGL